MADMKFFIRGIIVVSAVLLCIMPAAAINVAVYGDTAGFNPALHTDMFTVVYSLPGTYGSELDTGVAEYTNASTDVIFIGGNTTFGTDTASQIESAVASGKILVVTQKNFPNFAGSIPVQGSGSAPLSLYMKVMNPNTSVSQDIFAGMATRFENTTPVSGRVQYASKTGSVPLLGFDNDDPALLYTKYQNGYIVAWTLAAPGDYLTAADADTINKRLITWLLAMRGPVVTSAATTAVTVPVTSIPANVTSVAATPSVSPAEQEPGSVSVYSSPLGANVFLDGAYKGTAPLNLTAVTPGSHALKMALDGYYDYDSTIYVIPGGITTAFGTLPPRSGTAVVVTIAPTTTPVVTATPASLWESPAVVTAILGTFTAIIGAAVTLYTISRKKDGDKK